MSSITLLTLFFAVFLPAAVALWAASRWLGAPSPPSWSSFSGGVLTGAACLVVLPQVSAELGFVLLGLAFSFLVDRFIHPLCSGCGGHGSPWASWPLWLALGAHSLMDGALIELAQPGSLASWLLLGHRIPEVLAIVGLLRSLQMPPAAIGRNVALLQLLVLAGLALATGWNQSLLQPLLRETYAFAGGALLFLGCHKLHHTWKESSLCWPSSLSGLAAVFVIHLGLSFLEHH